ncbi:hypothetical protein [Agrobacterium tumefaciens]|uniref:hypothetical protein n=1 Tax=Agrobacterium tumefaciens TaxID=358 RepID=UPI001572E44F|nr:hypothetical protein [Agrobacterium tumefaciens]NTE33167.1 hypothetical protein [Agrobacterium tumefaciens]NTE48677.1 hypothetical protein [Agrobacterium tumefaciens]
MNTKIYYFACRVTRPFGRWVVEGPYEYDDAKRERERAKAPDMQVQNVFSAASRQEAEEKARSWS